MNMLYIKLVSHDRYSRLNQMFDYESVWKSWHVICTVQQVVGLQEGGLITWFSYTGKCIHVDKRYEWEWRSLNILRIQEIYLTSFEYIYIRNTCISDQDIFETDWIHLLYYEDIHKARAWCDINELGVDFCSNPFFFV